MIGVVEVLDDDSKNIETMQANVDALSIHYYEMQKMLLDYLPKEQAAMLLSVIQRHGNIARSQFEMIKSQREYIDLLTKQRDRMYQKLHNIAFSDPSKKDFMKGMLYALGKK